MQSLKLDEKCLNLREKCNELINAKSNVQSNSQLSYEDKLKEEYKLPGETLKKRISIVQRKNSIGQTKYYRFIEGIELNIEQKSPEKKMTFYPCYSNTDIKD